MLYKGLVLLFLTGFVAGAVHADSPLLNEGYSVGMKPLERPGDDQKIHLDKYDLTPTFIENDTAIASKIKLGKSDQNVVFTFKDKHLVRIQVDKVPYELKKITGKVKGVLPNTPPAPDGY